METPDQKFQSQLHDKVFVANKNDRSSNTDKIVQKLDELKPNEKSRKSQDAMAAFFQSMKGDPGENGITPEKGVDYLTDEEIQQIKEELRPKKGIDYQDGEPGKTPVPGVDFPIPKDGESPDPQEIISEILNQIEIPEAVPGEPGTPGKDGSPDNADQIVEKLQTIKNAWLELSAIKGFDDYMQSAGNSFLQQAKAFVPRTLDSLYDVAVRGVIADGQSLIYNAAKQKWVPGTGSGSGSLAVETPNGTLDGSNKVFTVTNTPVFLTLNGQVLTASGVDYTYSGGTITLVNAPFSTDILRSYHN